MTDGNEKLKQLQHRARRARDSISEELGFAAGATVDQMRYILEEIMVHRIDKLVRVLREQHTTYNSSQKNLQQYNQSIEGNLNRITDDNQRLNAQIENFAKENSVRNAINAKLNSIQIQNVKILNKIGIHSFIHTFICSTFLCFCVSSDLRFLKCARFDFVCIVFLDGYRIKQHQW